MHTVVFSTSPLSPAGQPDARDEILVAQLLLWDARLRQLEEDSRHLSGKNLTKALRRQLELCRKIDGVWESLSAPARARPGSWATFRERVAGLRDSLTRSLRYG